MIYYQVMEYDHEGNGRRIYTFDNESDAWDLVEFFLKHDEHNLIGVEEYESPTEL